MMDATKLYKTQLPDDVQLAGYRHRSDNRFEFESMWFSPANNFTGSESEFVRAGLAYCYVDIDEHTRRVVK